MNKQERLNAIREILLEVLHVDKQISRHKLALALDLATK
jgi:hypothetical protein